MEKCEAVVKHGQISLLISKNDDAYEEFADVLTMIDKKGLLCWYGDVTDAEGTERQGVVLTFSNIREKEKYANNIL